MIEADLAQFAHVRLSAEVESMTYREFCSLVRGLLLVPDSRLANHFRPEGA